MSEPSRVTAGPCPRCGSADVRPATALVADACPACGAVFRPRQTEAPPADDAFATLQRIAEHETAHAIAAWLDTRADRPTLSHGGTQTTASAAALRDAARELRAMDVHELRRRWLDEGAP